MYISSRLMYTISNKLFCKYIDTRYMFCNLIKKLFCFRIYFLFYTLNMESI